MLNCMLVKTGSLTKYGGKELLSEWQEDKDSVLWLDIDNEPANSERELLTQLGCHPLAITDVLRERHPPKVELFDNYIYMLYRGVLNVKENLDLTHLQISLFVGERIVITCHREESAAIKHFFTQRGERFLLRSPIVLALRIFHHSCGIYLESLFAFEQKLEELEDVFQSDGNDKLMQEIILYRSRITKLKRLFNYHKNIGAELKSYIEDETPLIKSSELHITIDVYERLERLQSLSQMHYDICGDLVNGYLSITSHQLNATMRILTVITAIFIPLGFLAGLYGMNFDDIPELHVKNGYYYLLAVMATLASTLIVLFKKIKWL